MMAYAKGEKPREMDAAKGGLVINRHQNWAKEENDDMHPLGTGLLGPENTQTYAKTGVAGKYAITEGDSKCKKPIKPRK